MGLDNSICETCSFGHCTFLVQNGRRMAELYSCDMGHYICGPSVEDCKDYTKRVTNTLYYD